MSNKQFLDWDQIVLDMTYDENEKKSLEAEEAREKKEVFRCQICGRYTSENKGGKYFSAKWNDPFSESITYCKKCYEKEH
jgi:hypothetical protein